MQRQWILGLLAIFLVIFPACLKTRAQMKEQPAEEMSAEEDEQARAPKAANVQEVSHGGYAIDEIKVELTRLAGRVEDLERQQKQGPAVNPEELKKTQERVATLEQNQADILEAIKKFQSAPPPSSEASQNLFESARKQYAAKEYEGAISSLTVFLKNPGKKAEDATFLRAESYFATKDYQRAIGDYSKITQKFAKSSHAPTAYYKIGLSFEALGMKEDAKPFFQELIDKFPKSPEAKKAKSRG